MNEITHDPNLEPHPPEVEALLSREREIPDVPATLTNRLWSRIEAAVLAAGDATAAPAPRLCRACARPVAASLCGECGAAVEVAGYHIEEVLVRNAHGRVYLARDPHGGRVALKELAFVQAPSAEEVAMFEREARILRTLDHPAIPRFVAHFQTGSGVGTRFYLAQEYIDGPSLHALLARHRFDEGESRRIAREVLDVLVYLQSLAPMVFHRDIKPANLIRRADGRIALVDFGAARDMGGSLGSTLVGTFGYMPVEQLGGIVDTTSDLYGLGATLCHLLSRREPWRLLEDGDPVGRLNVSEPFRGFLRKLVGRRATDRFDNAHEAREALENLGVVGAGKTRGPRQGVAGGQPGRPARFGVGALATIGIVGAMTVGGAALLFRAPGPRMAEVVAPVAPVLAVPPVPPVPPVLTVSPVSPVPPAPPAIEPREPNPQGALKNPFEPVQNDPWKAQLAALENTAVYLGRLRGEPCCGAALPTGKVVALAREAGLRVEGEPRSRVHIPEPGHMLVEVALEARGPLELVHTFMRAAHEAQGNVVVGVPQCRSLFEGDPWCTLVVTSVVAATESAKSGVLLSPGGSETAGRQLLEAVGPVVKKCLGANRIAGKPVLVALDVEAPGLVARARVTPADGTGGDTERACIERELRGAVVTGGPKTLGLYFFSIVPTE